MHLKVSCSLHMISCIPRLPKVRLLRTLSHPLVQLKVSCVHFILCSKRLSLYLSVMPIQDLLKLRPRLLTLATNKYIPAIREIRQLTEPIKYQKYPTVLYLVTMNYLDNNRPTIIWKVPDTLSDELILPARIAYELPDGKELRHGYLPGIMETSTAPNGCYNSDRSKGSIPLTIKSLRFAKS